MCVVLTSPHHPQTTMRVWGKVWLVVVVAAATVESQRRPSGQGVTTTIGGQGVTTRLGLLGPELGLPPVPIGGINQPARDSGIIGCVCLPVNQVCPEGQAPPPQNSQVGAPNHGAGQIDVRIVNLLTGGQCPGQKMCCPGGVIPPGPGPRPPPSGPVPINTGGCGFQNPLPIPNQPAKFAEAEFGEYPWVAVVLDRANNYKGGGVLISENWVLTAAHKVAKERDLKVRLGEHDVTKPKDHPNFDHIEIPVGNIIIHPDFKADTLQNDVGLLNLQRPVNTNQFPHIGTACLPRQGQIFAGENQCWVTGFGKDAFDGVGEFQRILKEVDVPVQDPFVCQERLRNTRLGQTFILDRNSFLCAGGIEGKDACTGDGGAPLVCKPERGQWTVAGLVAWGIGCATSEVPGVYVNIASYADFIRRFVRV